MNQFIQQKNPLAHRKKRLLCQLTAALLKCFKHEKAGRHARQGRGHLRRFDAEKQLHGHPATGQIPPVPTGTAEEIAEKPGVLERIQFLTLLQNTRTYPRRRFAITTHSPIRTAADMSEQCGCCFQCILPSFDVADSGSR